MDWIERRMAHKVGGPIVSEMVIRSQNTPNPHMPPVPHVPEIIEKKSGRKPKFIIPNTIEEIVEMIVDKKPSVKDVRKALEKYISLCQT